MREFSHLTGIAVGSAVVALTAGGFALTPASTGQDHARPAGVIRPHAAHLRIQLGSIQPGIPMKRARNQLPSPIPTVRGTSVNSTNWAGYAATNPSRSFQSVTATFFVPYVNCTATPSTFSAHWAGLDGFDTNTVEQTGVLAACLGSTPSYSAWYEMFPRFPVYPHITVRPGDAIVVSVVYRKSSNRFVLSLADTSNGARFSRTIACPGGSTCHRSSAEVISEAPANDGTILPLTDFRALSFAGVRLSDQAGFTGTLRSGRWTTAKIINLGGGNVLDQPTQLFRGAAFDTYWMRSG
ncbi:MAG TPA: G1 family glutamic endopeptidase [Streptosporangiaceae bacterium]